MQQFLEGRERMSGSHSLQETGLDSEHSSHEMWLDPEHHTPPGPHTLTRARHIGRQDRARNLGGQDRALLRRPTVPSHAMGLCHWEFDPRQPHFPAAAAFMRKQKNNEM